jgi:hypothetical protein
MTQARYERASVPLFTGSVLGLTLIEERRLRGETIVEPAELSRMLLEANVTQNEETAHSRQQKADGGHRSARRASQQLNYMLKK